MGKSNLSNPADSFINYSKFCSSRSGSSFNRLFSTSIPLHAPCFNSWPTNLSFPFLRCRLAICQAIIPFFKLLASIPTADNLLTAGTLRCPVAQMQTISRSLGTSFMRLPNEPSGINFAPAICPSWYSCGWRTSSRKGRFPFFSSFSNSSALNDGHRSAQEEGGQAHNFFLDDLSSV